MTEDEEKQAREAVALLQRAHEHVRELVDLVAGTRREIEQKADRLEAMLSRSIDAMPLCLREDEGEALASEVVGAIKSHLGRRPPSTGFLSTWLGGCRRLADRASAVPEVFRDDAFKRAVHSLQLAEKDARSELEMMEESW